MKPIEVLASVFRSMGVSVVTDGPFLDEPGTPPYSELTIEIDGDNVIAFAFDASTNRLVRFEAYGVVMPANPTYFVQRRNGAMA